MIPFFAGLLYHFSKEIMCPIGHKEGNIEESIGLRPSRCFPCLQLQQSLSFKVCHNHRISKNNVIIYTFTIVIPCAKVVLYIETAK